MFCRNVLLPASSLHTKAAGSSSSSLQTPFKHDFNFWKMIILTTTTVRIRYHISRMYNPIPERWRSTCMSGILIRAINAIILPITDVCFEDTLRIVAFEKSCLTIHLQKKKKSTKCSLILISQSERLNGPCNLYINKK